MLWTIPPFTMHPSIVFDNLGFPSYFMLIRDPIGICVFVPKATMPFLLFIPALSHLAWDQVERLRSGLLRESLACPCCGRLALFLHIFLLWLNPLERVFLETAWPTGSVLCVDFSNLTSSCGLQITLSCILPHPGGLGKTAHEAENSILWMRDVKTCLAHVPGTQDLSRC